MSRHRHRARTGAPPSTKLVVALGLALVVSGFGLAGWQRLAEGSDGEGAPPTTYLSTYLPGARSVAMFALAIAVAVVAGGCVLIRSRRRGGGY